MNEIQTQMVKWMRERAGYTDWAEEVERLVATQEAAQPFARHGMGLPMAWWDRVEKLRVALAAGSEEQQARCEATSPDGQRCKYRLGHDANGEPHSWTLFGFGPVASGSEERAVAHEWAGDGGCYADHDCSGSEEQQP